MKIKKIWPITTIIITTTPIFIAASCSSQEKEILKLKNVRVFEIHYSINPENTDIKKNNIIYFYTRDDLIKNEQIYELLIDMYGGEDDDGWIMPNDNKFTIYDSKNIKHKYSLQPKRETLYKFINSDEKYATSREARIAAGAKFTEKTQPITNFVNGMQFELEIKNNGTEEFMRVMYSDGSWYPRISINDDNKQKIDDGLIPDHLYPWNGLKIETSQTYKRTDGKKIMFAGNEYFSDVPEGMFDLDEIEELKFLDFKNSLLIESVIGSEKNIDGINFESIGIDIEDEYSFYHANIYKLENGAISHVIISK